jgi:hypothetical protein
MPIKPKVLLSCLPLMFILSCGGGGGGGDDPGPGPNPGPNPGDTLNPGLVGRFFFGALTMDADTGEYIGTPNTDWYKHSDRFRDAGVKTFTTTPSIRNGSAFLVLADGNNESSVALQDYDGNYLGQINLTGAICDGTVSQDLQHVLICRNEGVNERYELYDWNATLIDDKLISKRSMTWLRDNRILYSAGRTFYTTKQLSMEPDDAFTMTLPEPGVGNMQTGVIGDYSVSPDETQIAFVVVDLVPDHASVGLYKRQNARLYMVNRDGTGLRRVATVYGEDPDALAICGVSWSPDGRWLYVMDKIIPNNDSMFGLTFYPNMYLIPTEDMGKVFTLSTNVAERSPEVRLFYRYFTLANESGGKTNKATFNIYWIPDR